MIVQLANLKYDDIACTKSLFVHATNETHKLDVHVIASCSHIRLKTEIMCKRWHTSSTRLKLDMEFLTSIREQINY